MAALSTSLCHPRRCIEIIAVVSFEQSACSPHAIRFFGTFRRFQDSARRTGKATLGRLVNPPLLVNPLVIPSRDANAGGIASGRGGKGGRTMKEKEELSTRIANYPWKQTAVDVGGRSRWHRKLLRSSIGQFWPQIQTEKEPKSREKFLFERSSLLRFNRSAWIIET